MTSNAPHPNRVVDLGTVRSTSAVVLGPDASIPLVQIEKKLTQTKDESDTVALRHNRMTLFFISMALSVTVAIAIAFSLASNVNVAEGEQLETEMAEYWAIEIPTVSLEDQSTTFTMDYGIGDWIVTPDNVRVDILTKDCSYPKLTDGVVQESLTATGEHVFQIDLQTMAQNDDIYSNETPGEAQVDLCLRYMLWTGPESDADSIEVNYLETILTLEIDLTAGFEISAIEVAMKDSGTGNAVERDDFTVQGYLCDPNTRERINTKEFNQGSLVTICVEIEERATRDGIFLDQVDEFKFVRQIGTFNLTQVAVENGQAASDGLTYYDCPPGSIVCMFQSMLYASFFMTSGEIFGEGTATMGFASLPEEDGGGTESGERRRALEQRRALQGGSSFEITIPIEPLDDTRPPLKTAGGMVLSGVTRAEMILVVIACALILDSLALV
mmetsp:Transcript_14133/g.31685  ORF Transcript_14133/g.31685 Transcript_14133/m.31685 type:complete len:442 (+) Transcript_14133:1-1326(+)|eukprot:CAMPEP_0201145510 /NCGR_PEP_ID=MMETSP0851-20130426/7238_1 /ASSEMBLY_ACC=CAM_ASM_000631 /TAXON_ID=183588 /ORGANISM="Pseudo-nitzschia fraudulenta, Strain WWA7" /LENGTH=441 /DNA_ID=CAMNT_0047420697 /DNA_START=3 /DNA_END=1328 /DNA_ORIENTATION=-